MDEDDALFAEVLALLADATPHQEVSRRNQKPYAIGSAARRKIAIDALKHEEQQLSEVVKRLRSIPGSLGSASEVAATERFKRRRAEVECQRLRDAVYRQTQFLRGLRGMLSIGSERYLTLNLCHHLHNFVRLPRCHATRRDEYLTLTDEARLRAAMNLVQGETEAISVTDSHIGTDFIQESDESCAVTTKSVFVLGQSDVPTVLRAACVAVRDIVVRCRAFECIGVSGKIVDADAVSPTNLQYRLMSIRRKSSRDKDDFAIESRAVTIYKTIGECAVLLWDFVDVDELHPVVDIPDISRQSVGACVIRQERTANGLLRTVYREVSTRRYVYHGKGTPSAGIERYLLSMRLSMESNELLFRDIMVEQIANESRYEEESFN